MWAGWLVQRRIEGAPGNSIRWRRKGVIDRSRNLPGSPQQQRPRDSLDSIYSCTMLCQQYIYGDKICIIIFKGVNINSLSFYDFASCSSFLLVLRFISTHHPTKVHSHSKHVLQKKEQTGIKKNFHRTWGWSLGRNVSMSVSTRGCWPSEGLSWWP